MTVAVLVPRRSDGGHRDRLWTFCRAWLEEEHPDFEIVEGADLGEPFNRSASINDAASRTKAPTLAVMDSDVIVPPDQLNDAVKLAEETGQAVLAFSERVELNQRMTDRVLDGFDGRWDDRQSVVQRFKDHVSSCVVVPRALFERCGGFDERFVGWAPEDRAFHHVARVLGGGVLRVTGPVFHLWHEASRRNKRTAEFAAGSALVKHLWSIVRPDDMERHLTERQIPNGILQVFVTHGRPDCLTRAVPSFDQHLSGPVVRRVVVDDSGDPDFKAMIRLRWPDIDIIDTGGSKGFAGAYQKVWATIAAYGLPWAFIVEDDFTAERSIDLAAMQQVMDDRPGLVQMALRRQAWSAPELEAGGVIEQHPDDYTDLPTHLEHRRFFTTNPCLIRRELTATPWPKSSGSEAQFTRAVFADPNARSGYWGARTDAPWVIHDGPRTGRGY